MPFQRYLTDEQRKLNRKESYRKWKAKTGYRWRDKFPEKAKVAEASYYAKNKDRVRAKQAEWAAMNPGKATEYHRRWVAKNPEWQKRYMTERKEHFAALRRQKHKERKATDPAYRLLCGIKRRLNAAIHRAQSKKTLRTQSILGCDIYSFMTYIESLWQEGMSWENYGLYGWHLDHIMPLAIFDMANPEHVRRAWHFQTFNRCGRLRTCLNQVNPH